MTPSDWIPLAPLGYLAAALVFLLVGWRLGRLGAPRPAATSDATAPDGREEAEEPDPWTAAALGLPPGSVDLDSFETVHPVPGGADAGGATRRRRAG